MHAYTLNDEMAHVMKNHQFNFKTVLSHGEKGENSTDGITLGTLRISIDETLVTISSLNHGKFFLLHNKQLNKVSILLY